MSIQAGLILYLATVCTFLAVLVGYDLSRDGARDAERSGLACARLFVEAETALYTEAAQNTEGSLAIELRKAATLSRQIAEAMPEADTRCLRPLR